MITCPECGSTNVQTERKPWGESKCLNCGFSDSTSYFEQTTPLSEKLNATKEKLAKAEALASSMSDRFLREKGKVSIAVETLENIRKFSIPEPCHKEIKDTLAQIKGGAEE